MKHNTSKILDSKMIDSKNENREVYWNTPTLGLTGTPKKLLMVAVWLIVMALALPFLVLALVMLLALVLLITT
jgi:hypothetical protein